jgi:hypothetical protein
MNKQTILVAAATSLAVHLILSSWILTILGILIGWGFLNIFLFKKVYSKDLDKDDEFIAFTLGPIATFAVIYDFFFMKKPKFQWPISFKNKE